MELNKKITSKIWDNCAKQLVDGYIFVKMDDIIKLNIEKEDLIVDDLEVINKNDMNYIASYLNKEGWIFEHNPDTGDTWKRRLGDIHNRTLA
jgi:N-acetylmuramoyl-L-alanine amidase CwlA